MHTEGLTLLISSRVTLECTDFLEQRCVQFSRQSMAQQQSLGRTLSESKHDLSSYSSLINRHRPLNHHNNVDATSTCSTTQIIRETGSARSDTQLSDRSVHNRSSDSSSAHSLSNNSSGVTSSFRSDMPSAFGIVGAGEVRIVSFFYS